MVRVGCGIGCSFYCRALQLLCSALGVQNFLFFVPEHWQELRRDLARIGWKSAQARILYHRKGALAASAIAAELLLLGTREHGCSRCTTSNAAGGAVMSLDYEGLVVICLN